MLERNEAGVEMERNSRKEPLDDSEARKLLAGVSKVKIARGRKLLEMRSGEATPEDLKGPTGNYRAPMVVVGKTLLVGFNAEALAELL